MTTAAAPAGACANPASSPQCTLRPVGRGTRTTGRRHRKAAAEHVHDIAASLGLGYVRTPTPTDLEQMYRDTRGGRIARSRFSRLLRSSLLILEAAEGEDTRYLTVETPFRATPEDVSTAEAIAELMAELAGCPCRPVIACVVRDSSAEAGGASSQVHWYAIEPGDLEAESLAS